MCAPSCSFVVTRDVPCHVAPWQGIRSPLVSFPKSLVKGCKPKNVQTGWTLQPIVSFRRCKPQLPGPTSSPSQTENVSETFHGLTEGLTSSQRSPIDTSINVLATKRRSRHIGECVSPQKLPLESPCEVETLSFGIQGATGRQNKIGKGKAKGRQETSNKKVTKNNLNKEQRSSDICNDTIRSKTEDSSTRRKRNENPRATLSVEPNLSSPLSNALINSSPEMKKSSRRGFDSSNDSISNSTKNSSKNSSISNSSSISNNINNGISTNSQLNTFLHFHDTNSKSCVRSPWPGNLSAISSEEKTPTRTNEDWAHGSFSWDQSCLSGNTRPPNSVAVLSRDMGLERGKSRFSSRDGSPKSGKGGQWQVETVDNSLLELVPLKTWNEEPEEYRGSLAVQVSKRERVRCILIEELQARSMPPDAAVTVASKVPLLINELLLEAKQADWAAYSRGLPLAESLPDQIRDMLERNGTSKIVSYLYNLGMEASCIGRALNSCNLHFSDVVAQVQLLHSVGVQPQAVAQVLSGCPNFLRMPLETLRANMTCLQAVGVKGVDLGRVIEIYPKILTPAVQICMQPCVCYLHDLGILPRGISKMIRTYPQILGCSVTATLQPAVESLRSAGLSKLELVKAVTKCPGLLACSVQSNILPSLNFLEGLVGDKETVSKLVTKNPEVLTLNIKRNIIPTLTFFESIGMERKAIAKMVLRNGRVLCCSLSNIASKIDLLESFGLTREEVVHMVYLFPSIVNYSEDTLRIKHSYLVENMGRKVQELVNFPHYFGYHLETRIQARHRRLQEISSSCAVSTMLVCTDEEFQKLCSRFVHKNGPK